MLRRLAKVFELANGGTLLLDEIGDLTPAVQVNFCECCRSVHLNESAAIRLYC
jgi:transcriptional regulator with AAA-type ATPase domain